MLVISQSALGVSLGVDIEIRCCVHRSPASAAFAATLTPTRRPWIRPHVEGSRCRGRSRACECCVRLDVVDQTPTTRPRSRRPHVEGSRCRGRSGWSTAPDSRPGHAMEQRKSWRQDSKGIDLNCAPIMEAWSIDPGRKNDEIMQLRVSGLEPATWLLKARARARVREKSWKRLLTS